jgi:hypothetical protein
VPDEVSTRPRSLRSGFLSLPEGDDLPQQHPNFSQTTGRIGAMTAHSSFLLLLTQVRITHLPPHLLNFEESLPIFYYLATVSLKHEAYLYILRRKIGPENMARLQSVVVAGFRNEVHKIVVVELPATRRKLSLGWKGNTASYGTTRESHLNDEQLWDFLDQTFRHYLDPSVEELFTKARNLQIFLDTILATRYVHLDYKALSAQVLLAQK